MTASDPQSTPDGDLTRLIRWAMQWRFATLPRSARIGMVSFGLVMALPFILHRLGIS